MDNCFFIDVEQLMIIIDQSLSHGSNEKENDATFSVKDFLLSNGSTTGLVEINAAIKDLKLLQNLCWASANVYL